MERLAAHRGNIAQGATKGLPSNFLRFVFGQIVNALDNAICFQQEHLADSEAFDYRAIVARAHERVSSEGKISEKDCQ
jgi:hypothetical protein